MLKHKIELLESQIQSIKNRIENFKFNISWSEKSYKASLEKIITEIKDIKRLIKICEILPKELEISKRFIRSVFEKIELLSNKLITEFDLDWIYLKTAHEQKEQNEHYYQLTKLINEFENEYLIIPVISSSFQSFYIPTSSGNRHFACIPNSAEDIKKTHLLVFHEIGHIFLHETNETQIFRPLDKTLKGIEEKINFDIKSSHGEISNKKKKEWDEINKYWDLWRKELFCDSYALFVSGPAYALSLIQYCYPTDPFEISHTHPPLEIRVSNLVNFMKQLNYPERIVSIIENKWNTETEYSYYTQTAKYDIRVNTLIFTEIKKCLSDFIQQQYKKYAFDVDSLEDLLQRKSSKKDSLIHEINKEWIDLLLDDPTQSFSFI